MIFPDVNILVYAHDETSKHHAAARQWWEDKLNDSRTVHLSCPCSWFLVLGSWGGWLEQPHVRIVDPPDSHFKRLALLIEHIGTAGNLTTDAHLAAMAIITRWDTGRDRQDACSPRPGDASIRWPCLRSPGFVALHDWPLGNEGHRLQETLP
jgi:hypothetical protein